jgi:RHS repeat-associated protein
MVVTRFTAERRMRYGWCAAADGAVLGYEAWLSAKVDRQGLVLQVIYDERMRISQLWDATVRLNWEGVPDARQGGVTRFFYPDTDPRWSLEQRNQHRELEARDISAAGAALNLLTSVVDPYGRRVQFDYQDMLTGLHLGDESSDFIRENSRYWRLVATQDVLGVRSDIRYTCGFSTLATSAFDLDNRRNELNRVRCFNGAQIASDWNLVRETQTPYGVTRYARIDRTDSRGRGMKGWMVTTPNGLVERWETLMGTAEGDLLTEINRARPNGQGQLEPLIQSRSLPRPAHIPASAWPSGLGELSVYHRLSFHWSPKAMSVGPGRLVSDPSYAVGVLPPLETATIRQYLEDVAPGSGELSMSPWVMAEKGPLTGWVYYYREGQAAVDRLRNSGEVTTRALPSPSIVARVLDNGQVQASYVQYNEAGDARYVVDPQGRATELEYQGRDVSAVYQVAWNAGAPLRLALLGRYSYNSKGQIIGQYGAGPNEWVSYKYDQQAPYALLRKTYPSDTDGGTRTTNYVWSEESSASLAKRLTRLTVTDADGLSTVSEYKGGVLIARRSQGMEERWWGHDAFGRPRSYSLVQSDGSTREHVGYEYEGLELRAIRNALDGSRTQITPDHLGRPQHIQHLAADGSLLQEWWREYDESGGVSALRGPTVADLSGVLFDYDLMGRVIQRTEPDSSTIRISYERSHSRIHSVTDARNISTYLSYDLSDALLNKRIRNPMAEPVMRLVYDPYYSRVNRQSDALGTTTYHYTDATHPYRVTQIDEPLAGASAMGAARETRTVPSYDSLGRLRAWQLTDNNGGPARSWMQTEFNAQGLIARYSNEIFSAIPRYDLVQESVGLYGDLNAVDYQLEAGAALPEMILSITRTGIDEQRKLRSLNYQTVDGNIGSTLHYDGQGRIDRVEGLIGNGIHNYRYDGLSQLKQSAHWRNTPGGMEHVSTTGYTYDSKGNREGLIEQNAAGVDVAPIVSTSYSGYNLDAYQLRTDTSRNAQHDAAGNITYNPSNQQTYQWDDEGRLSRIIYPSKWGKPDNYTQFTYDAQRRIRRIQEVQYGDSIEDMTYVWVGNQLAQKRDTASQRIVQTYNNDGYTDIAADGSSSKYILLRNHQSSVIGKTNLQGQVLERIDYTPEGKIQSRQVRDSSGTLSNTSAASDLPFGYAGYWQHHRSGLSITKFRFYDPALARWLSKDPIRELGGFNPYAYVGNNTTNFTDPSGLNPTLEQLRLSQCRSLRASFEQYSQRNQELERNMRVTSSGFAQGSGHDASSIGGVFDPNHTIVEMQLRYLASGNELGWNALINSPQGRSFMSMHREYTENKILFRVMANDMRRFCRDDRGNGPPNGGTPNEVYNWVSRHVPDRSGILGNNRGADPVQVQEAVIRAMATDGQVPAVDFSTISNLSIGTSAVGVGLAIAIGLVGGPATGAAGLMGLAWAAVF